MKRQGKRILLTALTAILLAGLLVTGASAAGFSRTRTYTPGQFADVPANAWYADSVKNCYELGLMGGSGPDTFNPNGTLTVAEILTVAARMHNIYHGGSGTIPAAEGFWFQGAVDYCLKNGIITEGQFAYYTGRADRAEMVGILAAALPESAFTAVNQVTELPDVHKTTPYQQDIFMFYKAGIITGSDGYGMFHPYSTISRAEAAAILARVADPSLRKSFALLSVTERAQTILPVKNRGYLGEMSCGMLAYQDENYKWGYLNDEGKVVIPARYSRVEEFKDGLAVVHDETGSTLIDTAGKNVLPGYSGIKSLGNGVYAAFQKNGEKGSWLYADGQIINLQNASISLLGSNTRDGHISSYQSYGCPDYFVVFRDWNVGIIDRSGRELVPVIYERGTIQCSGRFFIVEKKEGGEDVYNLEGEFLGSFDDVDWKNGVYFLGGKIGEKYAIVSQKGVLTEAVFDQVMIEWSNKYGVTARKGFETALYSADGDVIISMGKYRYGLFTVEEDYILCEENIFVNGKFRNTDKYMLDLKGNYIGAWDTKDIVYEEDGYFVDRAGRIYDQNKNLIKGAKVFHGVLTRGYMYLGSYRCYQGMNGKYGVCDSERIYTDPIYDDPYEASEAAWDYVPGTFGFDMHRWLCYSISTNNYRRASDKYYIGLEKLGEDCFAGPMEDDGPLYLVRPRYPQ